MPGFNGKVPSVSVIRGTDAPPPDYEQKAVKILEGKTIHNVTFDGDSLTLAMSDGSQFSITTEGGFMEEGR